MVRASKSAGRDFDKRALLRNHPIFGDLRPDLLEHLNSRATRRNVRSGTTIFTRGDPGTSLFAVCAGTIRISSPSPGGRSAIFNLISKGAVFGEIALLDGLTRTAGATAVNDCELMVIERRDFIPLIHEQPEIALAKKSRRTASGPKITLTQSDIGEMIGMSRESTNKQLRAWQDRKWLRLRRGGIVILNPDALADVAPAADDE